MDTYEQMMVDNRYPGDSNHEKYSFKQRPVLSHKDDDGSGSQGRRVYLESPSFGNKEEEDMYRYVPSRLTDGTASMIGPTIPAATGATLMDSLDFDLDILDAHQTRSDPLYRPPPKPASGTRQLSNMPRADPRDDPLLGPLLAELDAMSNQQQQQPASTLSTNYRRNSVPYQPNLTRPIGSSPSNHALTNIANRTVNDALLDAELYNSLNRIDQPVSTFNSNSYNLLRPANMNGTDIFVPSSYTATPGSFLDHFGHDDQLFQRPLLNTLGQNYVPNPRPPLPAQQQQQQRDILFDQSQRPIYPPSRNYAFEQQPVQPPPPNPFIEYQRAPPQQPPRHEQQNPPDNQTLFFTDNNDEQVEHQQPPPLAQPNHRNSDQQDQDSRRQAVWNELHRTNVKVQEKNVKKHESANRNRAPFGSTLNWTNSNTGSQHSSPLARSPQRPFHHPPPVSKPNHVDDNIDMIKNKENFYHRYPPRKYENTYSKRKDFPSETAYDKQQEQEPRILPPPTNPQRHTSLPVTVNLNTNDSSQSAHLPGTVTIPLDSHINRSGDKISVNIDLRLVDLQNLQQQQQQQQQQQGMDQPHWTGGDPLDRHIRKLERNIEQNLPPTHSPQRSPVLPIPSTNPSLGRYAKQPTRGGYNPPVYGGGDDRNRDEDSYLARLNYARRNNQFKPYTGRDYEQFKKNYGFGIGHLGFDFDNTNHKEKSETLAKTRQYAQQIEARNKKKIAEASRRTLSDTRLPKASRVTDVYDT